MIRKQIDKKKKGDFSEKDIYNAKTGIIANVKTITDEQDTEVSYHFSQELSQNKISVDEYIQKINNVSKDDIIDIANKVNINTVYFLRD